MKKLIQGYFCFSLVTFLCFTLGFHTNINSPADIVPCELLTPEQVETVLPGHDGGFTAMSGGSLMKGVDSYQCSYSDKEYNLLTVIVHVAADAENFDWIRPKPRVIKDMYDDAKDLDLGDGGWLYGDPDDMKLKAAKGFTVIELELMSPNAGEKDAALVELAKILLKKI